MSKAYYLAFDTETGGLDPNRSPILTLDAFVLDRDLNVMDELNMAIKVESPFDHVEPEALAVNGIVLEQHQSRPDLLTRSEAKTKMSVFMEPHVGSGKKKNTLRPFGQNVSFDVDMLRAQIFTNSKEYSDLFHYHKMDTVVATNILKDAGLVPPELGKLASLCEHFGVPLSNAHNSRADILATISVYRKMIQMLRDLKSGSGLTAVDIIKLIEA